MKIDEAIRLSLLAWIRRRVDPTATTVTGWGNETHVGGNYYTRIHYTHSGPTRDVRSFLYREDWRTMFEQIDLDLTEES